MLKIEFSYMHLPQTRPGTMQSSRVISGAVLRIQINAVGRNNLGKTALTKKCRLMWYWKRISVAVRYDGAKPMFRDCPNSIDSRASIRIRRGVNDNG